jgi:carbamate kinase
LKKKIVIALGGNALGNNLKEQREAVQITAKPIVDLLEAGHQVVLTHGNGPQVGMINLAMALAHGVDEKIEGLSMSMCVAMSQGYIGYDLQNALRAELLSRRMNIPVSTIITQVVVDKNAAEFKNPTKPIGQFYSKEDADKMIANGATMIEDSGRGYRHVIASPKPIGVVEKETIKTLVDAGQLVITVGGGGIPVIVEGNELIGASAVIDKDFAAALLASLIDADMLIILTAVEKVAINFGKPNVKWLDTLNITEAEQYIKEGHFAPGSMLPKVEAALNFAKSKKGRTALITLLEKADLGIQGKTGTRISL